MARRRRALSCVQDQWNELGAGTNGPVNVLAPLPGGDMAVGGLFTVAGDGVSTYVARYSFGGPLLPIALQPVSNTPCRAGAGQFSITVSGDPSLPAYQWRRNSVALVDEPGHIHGAATATLMLTNITSADEGSYDCIVTNGCGATTSDTATLVICLGDFNCDGFVNSADFFDYLVAFFAINADFNNDGTTNSQDFFDFLAAFFGGC